MEVRIVYLTGNDKSDAELLSRHAKEGYEMRVCFSYLGTLTAYLYNVVLMDRIKADLSHPKNLETETQSPDGHKKEEQNHGSKKRR